MIVIIGIIIGVIGLTLFFIFKFPKQTGILVISLVGILILMIYVDSRHEKQKQLVLVGVTYDVQSCPVSRPLLINIHNETQKTVLAISAKIEVRKKGYSKNLVLNGSIEPIKTDKIIKSGEKFSFCWPLPTLDAEAETPANLEWGVESEYYDKSITFSD